MLGPVARAAAATVPLRHVRPLSGKRSWTAYGREQSESSAGYADSREELAGRSWLSRLARLATIAFQRTRAK
jgi:hypothetical protein